MSCGVQITMDCKNVDGTDSEKFVIFTQDDLHAECFPLMMEIRRQGKSCDVTLKVEDQSFSAHRNVLAATIPYFYAMFTSDMVESRMKEITMKEIDPIAMKLLINFAYSGSVKINNENVQTLMVGAAFLQMRVRDACAEFLIPSIDAHNVLGMKRIAGSLGCTQLLSEAEDYIQGNFPNIAQSDEFLELTVDELIDIIQRDELKVPTEEVIFEACMRWIKWNESRRAHLLQVLSMVRLPFLTSRFLTNRIVTEDLIRSSIQCLDLLYEVQNFRSMPERRRFKHNIQTRRRCYENEHIFVVGGNSGFMEIYDPLAKKWRMGTSMSGHQSRFSVAVINGKLFAFGGSDEGKRLSTVEVYDPKTKVWSRAMQRKRSSPAVAVLDDCVYICGGHNGVTALNIVECYLPKTDSWITVAPMMENRSGGGAAALSKYVYALGGQVGSSILDSVERYDPKENSWTKVSPMTNRRFAFSVATLNRKLYACGGFDGKSLLNSVEEYDPTKDEWRLIAPMNVARKQVALCTIMGKLWAVGGWDGESNHSSVEVWDPNEDTWSFAAPVSVNVAGVGVGVIPIS